MSVGDQPPPPADKPADEMTVEELAGAIRYHNWRYFALAEPEIDDSTFDGLTRQLARMAPRHPALQELVSDVGSGQKWTHDRPMLSLDKCYDEETLDRWGRSFRGDVIETPKIDGVAASIHYGADGALVAAVTRGDGREGEVFTANASFIEDIPNRLSGPALSGPVEVRGEIYMRLSVFETMGDRFSNPRNTTAGAIKQKDARKTRDYRLSFFVYDIFGVDLPTEMDKVAWSRAHGLTPVDTVLLDKTRMQASFDGWLQRRGAQDYEMDGVVYKANQVAEHARLGSTAHHPRWAIAYKFQGDSGASVLREIEWSVSRTGTITPVAIIEPVLLSGAMVGRCSLHNLSRVKELGLTPGATIVAMRRGGVIPHVEAVSAPGPGEPTWPAACPSCGGPTHVVANEQRKGGAVVRTVETLHCAAPASCPAAIRGTIEHFTRALDIEGFGPKMVEKLMDEGRLRTVADLFRLESRHLDGMDGVGEILARKLVGNVQDKRELSLAAFLIALGMDGLGAVTARNLATQFPTIEGILALTPEDLLPLDGFQETLAVTVVQGIAQRRDVIEDLLQVVTFESPAEAGPGGPLAGLSFVFTGAMATLDRKSAQKAVREAGGETPSAVVRELDYLVVGDKGSPLLGDGKMSTKHKKADAYNAAGCAIQVITEARFLEMLADPPEPAMEEGQGAPEAAAEDDVVSPGPDGARVESAPTESREPEQGLLDL